MKKQLELLLPELKNKKFNAQYMKREKTLHISIYTETNERFVSVYIEGELQGILRRLKLKSLGI